MLKAEAGYGKTTAIASFLAQSKLPYFWYSLDDAVVDPLTFLLHIIHAFRTKHPKIGEKALTLLAQKGGATRLWSPAVDALANDLLDVLSAETIFVFDDYTLAHQAEITTITERLIEQMPPQLHLVITTRMMPSLPSRARWRATGELLEIGRSQLAFTPDEIGTLFTQRTGQSLRPALAQALAAETEGWPIAVQLLSEGVGSTQTSLLNKWLRRIPGPLQHLFDYLAEEVLLRLPSDIQIFCAETATLRRLDPQACNALLGREDTEKILRYLEERSLFITGDKGAYRYHSLFRDFLLRRTSVPVANRRTLHSQAAAYYQEQGDYGEAVYHLLAAGNYGAAADLLATIARPMAYNGRHQTLAVWLDQLPKDLLDAHPELLLARGHAFRFASRYQEALAIYKKAGEQFEMQKDVSGEVRALRGQAQVYLDTVQPSQAEPLLRRALHKVDRRAKDERASLLILLAENKLNAGQLPQAERLHRAVHCAIPKDTLPPMNPRVYVRNGQFARARQMVEANLRADPWSAGERPPRSHREATVLSAWIDAMTGEANSARNYASQSLELGRALASPIIECVSLSRLGHGWLTGADFDPPLARDYYHESLTIAEQIGISRFKVESFLGLTLIAGMEGKGAEARAVAGEALAILKESGDRYMTGILTLALGAGLTLCDHPEAKEQLVEAGYLGRACGDCFSPCLADLWLAIHFSRLNQMDEARAAFSRALCTSKTHSYDFLFTGMPLLGPKNFTSRLMLLSQIPLTEATGRYAAQLREAISPWATRFDPYAFSLTSPATAALYIQTLGSFRIQQSGCEIEPNAWRRTKALQLLQFLVCRRGQLVHREQLLEMLWPDTSSTTAATGLRVALNELRRVLILTEAKDDSPNFIRREGEGLLLDMNLGVHVDADEFARLLKLAQTLEDKNPKQALEIYESGLALYRGDFLEEYPYAEWARQERENLSVTYLLAAERLARLLIERGESERGLRWANAIVAKDPLWEEGYVLLMQGHWKRGNRAQAVRIYDRCRRRLRETLNLDPSPHVIELYNEIIGV